MRHLENCPQISDRVKKILESPHRYTREEVEEAHGEMIKISKLVKRRFRKNSHGQRGIKNRKLKRTI